MIIKPPVVYVGTGYVHTRFEQWLVEQYRNICINVWYLEHSRKYPKVVEKYLKISDSILLDNGAVQAYRKNKHISPELVFYYGKKYDVNFLVMPDVIMNPKETRKLHEKFSSYIQEFNCMAVLQGANIGKKELDEDIDFYKKLGFKFFAFPSTGKRELIRYTASKVPYLHGLGMNFNLYMKYPFFNSIDIGSYRMFWFFYKLFDQAIIKDASPEQELFESLLKEMKLK